MREYAVVAPQFWTGETGKALRSAGREAQLLAIYLLTCPSSNMLGLYYLPLPTLVHETGIVSEFGSPFEGAREALRRVNEANFALYDEPSENVFVPEMARFQIGECISPKDNRHRNIVKELEKLRKSPFFNDFLRRYREPFNLHGVAENAVDKVIQPKPLRSPFEAPSKPGSGSGSGSGNGKAIARSDRGFELQAPPTPATPISQTALANPAKRIAFLEGRFVGVLNDDMRMWQDAYPAVAVPLELERAALWLKANPTKHKKNYFRFITNWMHRAQERGGTK